MERTDDNGRWVSSDGVSWALVEPSAGWHDRNPSIGEPPPPPPSAEERLAAAVTALAALDTIDAPTLPADIVAVLTDVRTALEA